VGWINGSCQKPATLWKVPHEPPAKNQGIISTNHYLTDAFGGGMVILVSFLLFELGFKRRFCAGETSTKLKQMFNASPPLLV